MDEDRQLSEFFEEAGITTRRSFLRRTAMTAAALVGLTGGVLLRPGSAAAYNICSTCVNYSVHSIDCDDCPFCCSNDRGCMVETIIGKDCHNDNILCWWSTNILCTCCC